MLFSHVTLLRVCVCVCVQMWTDWGGDAIYSNMLWRSIRCWPSCSLTCSWQQGLHQATVLRTREEMPFKGQDRTHRHATLLATSRDTIYLAKSINKQNLHFPYGKYQTLRGFLFTSLQLPLEAGKRSYNKQFAACVPPPSPAVSCSFIIFLASLLHGESSVKRVWW